MSWHDPARVQESPEDRELREELSRLLGVPVRGFFGVEPTPKMIALAEDLRREALRRRHTSRHRPAWMLLAAGLPLALAVGALGSWGFQHKQRADALAAAVTQKETELRQAKAAAEIQASAPRIVEPAQVPVSAPVLARNTVAPHKAARPTRPNGELVLEVKSYQAPSLDTQPVKGQ
ncbi:MAG TPA: hypothetical protein PKM35_02240 [Holophaga sp.]|nr:hypothetical protein [Holophaga sp.]HPS68615.1 hypothetical protein [Holophaga sp.]